MNDKITLNEQTAKVDEKMKDTAVINEYVHFTHNDPVEFLDTGFITGDELKNAVAVCMSNYTEKNINECSYDLRNYRQQRVPTSHMHENYKLYSGMSTLIYSREIIEVPLNCMVILKLRNSAILEGLSLTAPIYLPGHKTRLCARIRNDGPVYFEFITDESVIQAYFVKLSRNAKPYNGKYQNNI